MPVRRWGDKATMRTATLADTPEIHAMVAALRESGQVRRIAIVPGAGDVYGTFLEWQAGRDDPRLPAIGYSHMFYEAADALGAELLTLTEHGTGAAGPPRAHGCFTFEPLDPVAGEGLAYHRDEVRLNREAVRRARAWGADVLLYQRTTPHFWALIAGRPGPMRIVLSLHNCLWPYRRPPPRSQRLLAPLNRFAWARFAGTLCVSDGVADTVAAVVGRRPANLRVTVAQYAETRLGTPREPSALAGPGCHLVYVGRVSQAKGVTDLLDAFRAVRNHHAAVRLSIAGDGPGLAEVREQAGDPAFGGNVAVLGRLDGAAVAALLASADLFVSPTRSGFAEGMTKTPLEAAIMGVPSVISDAVPCTELLGDAVLEVPADDPAALAEALITLTDDPERRAAMARMALARRPVFFDRSRSSATAFIEALHEAVIGPA